MHSRLLALGMLLGIAAAPARLRAETVPPPPPPKAIDVLLVIDRATLTDAVRQRLLDAMPGFLDAIDDGLYGSSLHLAVITTDMGTGASNECGPGDGGRFQATPRGGCNGPTGSFLQSTFDPYTGEVTENFDGELVDALDCILPEGGQGCAYGQPVAAIQAALDGSVSENDGFLRGDAALVVLLVTGADDCTASDPLLFDPDQEVALGPLTPFRCFEHGATCDRAIDRAAGTYQDCGPRADSAYLQDPLALLPFLADLVEGPDKVVLGVIAAPAGTPVEVGLDSDGNPEVLASCTAVDTSATPAPRLLALAEAHAERSALASFCADDFTALMQQLASAVIDALTPPPLPPGPDAGLGSDAGPGVPDAGDGGAVDGPGGCGCSARGGDHTGSLLLGLALLAILSRRRRAL